MKPISHVGGSAPILYPRTAPDDACRMSVLEWLQAAKAGELLPKLSELAKSSREAYAALCVVDFLGWLEPAEAARPSALEMVSKTFKFVVVDPATNREDAADTPNEKRVLEFCAPEHTALIVPTLQIVPVNLTAMRSGVVTYKQHPTKRWNRLCSEFQGQKECAGVQNTLENIVLIGGASFEVYLKNYSTCSRGAWIVRYASWLAR